MLCVDVFNIKLVATHAVVNDRFIKLLAAISLFHVEKPRNEVLFAVLFQLESKARSSDDVINNLFASRHINKDIVHEDVPSVTIRPVYIARRSLFFWQ